MSNILKRGKQEPAEQTDKIKASDHNDNAQFTSNNDAADRLEMNSQNADIIAIHSFAEEKPEVVDTQGKESGNVRGNNGKSSPQVIRPDYEEQVLGWW